MLFPPAVAKSDAGILAVNDVLFIYVVVLSEPFNLTFEVERKFVPVTVRVKTASPTFLVDGEICVIVGALTP